MTKYTHKPENTSHNNLRSAGLGLINRGKQRKPFSLALDPFLLLATVLKTVAHVSYVGPGPSFQRKKSRPCLQIIVRICSNLSRRDIKD